MPRVQRIRQELKLQVDALCRRSEIVTSPGSRGKANTAKPPANMISATLSCDPALAFMIRQVASLSQQSTFTSNPRNRNDTAG